MIDSADLGHILANASGHVIYVFGKDSVGTSACSGGCAAAWPPVASSGSPTASAEITAQLGTITRSDGTTQVTVNGLPVYTFAKDTAPGDTYGQDFKNLWWVLNPSGTPIKPETIKVVKSATLGDILADENGHVIYVFGKDSVGTSTCSGGCAAAWPPVLSGGTPATSTGVTATLGTIARSDGSVQATVNGLPVYTFAKDTAPGDTYGQNFKDLWWVLAPDGNPIKTSVTATPTAKPSPTSGSYGY